jgi:adenosylcobinamide-GDP ribazoletransferase
LSVLAVAVSNNFLLAGKFLAHASIRAVSGLLAAARYLTIVPVPGRRHADADRFGTAAPWFPVVGAAVGVLLAAVDAVTGRVFPPLLAALLTVTTWKLVTGGLHLDGLADCLDGLAGRDAAARLAIMRDSRIGAFGAIGLILFLLLELVAVAELPAPARWRTLIAAPAIARATPALLGRLLPPARETGHGAAFHAGLGRGAAPTALAVALVVAVVSLGGVGVVALAVAVASAALAAAFVARRLGGVTGDVFGAGIEVAELAVLLTVSAWTHARS